MPRSGVRYDATLEWVMAAVWAGYRPDYFSEALDVTWQERVIAAYRSHLQIEGVVAQEQNRELERKRKSKRR